MRHYADVVLPARQRVLDQVKREDVKFVHLWFTDIEGHPHADGIVALASVGIVQQIPLVEHHHDRSAGGSFSDDRPPAACGGVRSATSAASLISTSRVFES